MKTQTFEGFPLLIQQCPTPNPVSQITHTYSPEFDTSTHFELYSPTHDVDPLITTNDGLAVPFNVQVRCCTAGDLKKQNRRFPQSFKQHTYYIEALDSI